MWFRPEGVRPEARHVYPEDFDDHEEEKGVSLRTA
jgi:hypothetical protein